MQLNRAAYDALREDVGDEAFGMIFEQFRQELAARGGQFAEKLAARDLKGLGDDAHTLKSTARTIGLDVIADAAAELETAVRSADAERAWPLARTLVGLCDEGLQALLQASPGPG